MATPWKKMTAEQKDRVCEKSRNYARKNAEERRAYAREYARRKRAEDPAAWRKKQLGFRLRREYGITLDEYDRMLAEQGGVCAICRIASGGSRGRLLVDHDHATGVVRGLLCDRCNFMVGQADDDPDRLRAAADYLEVRP